MKRLLFIILVFLSSCSLEKQPVFPVLVTADVSEITQTTAISGGTITDDGGGEILARGVCWSTNENPTTNDKRTSDGRGKGAFSSNITDLEPNTSYYVRAYTTNKTGTGYGNQIQFTTSQVEPWMQMPYFALPATGLSLMAGQEVTIYGDALINVPVHNNLKVTYTCDIGTSSGNNFVINPDAGNAGDHSITMNFTDNGVLLVTKTIKFTVYGKSGSGTRKILLIGDSTMPPDIQQQKIIEILNNMNFIFLGTIGTQYKNEGYGGASWNGFLTGSFGKFYSNGAFNLPAYFRNNSVDIPDYVFIRLGINDTFQFCRTGTGPITDNNIAKIISDAKTMIDAFLNLNPNLKVILGIPTITESSGDGWAHDYDAQSDNQNLFIEQIHRYWVSLIETFANGKYDPRVDCSYEAIFLDRDKGYVGADGAHTNGVHPNQSGFQQLATGMAITLNKMINEE